MVVAHVGTAKTIAQPSVRPKRFDHEPCRIVARRRGSAYLEGALANWILFAMNSRPKSLSAASRL
jgi:hypothetical protein